jgi:hypothetical protein
LATVLESCARQTDRRFFVAHRTVDRPPEDSEWPRANLAFKAGFFFNHLYVRVDAEAGFADRREVGGFSAGAVYIRFRRHCK